MISKMQAIESCGRQLMDNKSMKEQQEKNQMCSLKRILPISDNMKRYEKIQKISASKFNQTIPSSLFSERNQNKEEIYEESEEKNLAIIEEQSVVSSQMPMRQKYLHLLPGELGANFSYEQRFLIKMQNKIDEILDFLRLNREKTKGQLFSVIRKCLIEGSDIRLDLDHFKQILFIRPDFYTFAEKRQNEGKLDIMVALPSESDLSKRKVQFRKAMFDYVQRNKGFDKKIKIPSYQFSFSKAEDERKSFILKKIKQSSNENSNTSTLSSVKLFNMNHKGILSGVINPRQALIKGNRQTFEQNLLKKIKENEEKMRIEKEIQMSQGIQYGYQELLLVFDEIPQIFKRRDKMSLFKSHLISDLDKSLTLPSESIRNILEILMKNYPKFFNHIDHPTGEIIQVQKRFYSEIRKEIQMRDKNQENDNDGESENFPHSKIQILNGKRDIQRKNLKYAETPAKKFILETKSQIDTTAKKSLEKGTSGSHALDPAAILMKSISSKCRKSVRRN